MTIGIEATKAFEKEKTGVGWYSFYIIQELTRLIAGGEENLRLYVNPTLIPNSPSLRRRRTFPISNQLPITNYQLPNNITIKQLSWPLLLFWTQLRLSWEMMTSSPDVLFIPAHLPPLIHPQKLVVTIHDLAFKQYPEVYSKRELMLQEWGIKQVLKKAWRIIVPSEFTKSEIYKYYPDSARDNIYIVPHGIFKTQNHNLKLKTDVLYIGRLEHKKNIINLVKTFNIIKNNIPISNYQLLLIGSRGYGYDKIKKEINASPYKNNIKELGWLNHQAIVDHLTNAAVFVFPSLYEGFGLPVSEAMACGTAIACSDIPSLREVGGDVPVYFDPHNFKDMAEKIIGLLDNDTLKNQKIRQGLERAQKFSWQTAAQKTLDILVKKI